MRKDILKYTTLATYNDSFELVAIFDIDALVPFAVYFRGKDTEYYVDNPDWVFNKLPSLINRYLNRELLKSDKEEFSEELVFMTEDLAEELKCILEEGIKLGWNI